MPQILEILEAEYIEEAVKAGLSKEDRQVKIACRDVFQLFKNNLELNGVNKDSLATGLKVYLAAVVEITGLAIAMTGETDNHLLNLVTNGITDYAVAMKPRMDAARDAIAFLNELKRASIMPAVEKPNGS